MTEKGYYIKNQGIYYNDEYYCDFTKHNIITLLNHLSNENEQLKSKLFDCNLELEHSKESVGDAYYELTQLKKENEQLKKELQKYSNWCGSVKRENVDKVFKMSIFEIIEAFEYYEERIKDYEKVLNSDVDD